MFGSMLQKSGVRTDLYELCNIDLKDFSLQGKLDKPLIFIINNSFSKNEKKVPFFWKQYYIYIEVLIHSDGDIYLFMP
jgi:hypothetical protein